MNTWKTLIILLVSALAFVACGDDDGTKKSNNINSSNNANNANNTGNNANNTTGNNANNTTGNNQNNTNNVTNTTNGGTNNGTGGTNNATNNGTNNTTNNTNNTNNTTNNTNNTTNNQDGACNNDADIMELTNNIETIEDAAGACGQQCAFDQDTRTCAAMCIEMAEGVNLSSGCSDCFGATTECIVDNCLTQCFAGADSPQCVQCREDMCDPVFEMCAGFMIP